MRMEYLLSKDELSITIPPKAFNVMAYRSDVVLLSSHASEKSGPGVLNKEKRIIAFSKRYCQDSFTESDLWYYYKGFCADTGY
jgi:hypothetical protein